MRKVLVTRPIPKPALDLLRRQCRVDLVSGRPLGKQQLIKRLKGCSGLICLLNDTVDKDVLSIPGLVAVSNVAVGYNNIDVRAAAKRGILVTNTPGVLTEATADLTWCLLLAAARRLGEGERMVRARKFTGWGMMTLLGADVHGKTLGLIGLGRIGAAVARRAKGFGMDVLYCAPHPAPKQLERELNVKRMSLSSLLRKSDFISLHVPLTKATQHLIGEKEFKIMKRTAILVNTARGPVVDEAALVRALKSKRIAAAGLDVYEKEPRLAKGLAKLDNAVLAPHIGSATVSTRTKMALMAVNNMLAALKGRRPPNLVRF